MRRNRRLFGLVPRRLLRAFRSRGGRATGLPEAVIGRLRQAQSFLQGGRQAEAAEIFEAVADEAANRGLPHVARLSVEAGAAWILAGQLERGLPLAERGLDLLREREAGTRLAILRDRVVAALRQTGHSAEATALEQKYSGSPAEATALAQKYGGSPAEPPHPTRIVLPATCPQCGGKVRPDEVEWIDPTTAVCDYCGSVLKAVGE